MAGGSTFGAVAFWQEQADGLSVASWPAEHVAAVEHIPGGNIAVVQHLGNRGALEVALNIVVDEDDWAGFLALVGTTGTLTLLGLAARSATLLKVSNARWFEDEGIYKCQATWLG